MDQLVLNLQIENAQLRLQVLQLHVAVAQLEAEKVSIVLQNLLKQKEQTNEELA